MTAAYILMVVLLSGPYERPILSTQEFSDKVACEKALVWVRNNTATYRTPGLICMPKAGE